MNPDIQTEAIYSKLRSLGEKYENRKVRLFRNNNDLEKVKATMKRIESEVMRAVIEETVADSKDPEKLVKKHSNEAQRALAKDSALERTEEYKKARDLFMSLGEEAGKLSAELDILHFHQKNALAMAQIHAARLDMYSHEKEVADEVSMPDEAEQG